MPSPVTLTASRVVHALIAVIVTISFVIQIVLVITGGNDARSGGVDMSVGLDERFVRLFSAFTILSNLIVLSVAILLVIDPMRDGRFWRVLRLDALLSIVITGIVYAVVLAPGVNLTGWANVITIGFHYLSPWLTLGAWLVFGPRPRFTWGTVAWAFVWPTAWVLYTFVHGAISGWYPYPFLDVTKLGFAGAALNSLGVLVVAIVFAVLLKLVDRFLPAFLRG
ncbi:MAG TPA: Pr6Pr family membrane protein [Plantibacter sp.]|uniref:Pr6Pr family membrane protein n=1 Tax=unclassified Plantibacter TaxID=2624265 RepID=UPI002CA693EF|nr:Pr6Pr family membrane protein [Plantibacter sp.]